MVTRGKSFGPTAVGTADTKTTIGSAYSFPTSGRIKEIRCNFDQVTADIGVQGILTLDFLRLSGPFEWAVGGSGGKGTAGETLIPTSVVEVDIPYQLGEEVTVSLTTTEVTADATVSLTLLE